MAKVVVYGWVWKVPSVGLGGRQRRRNTGRSAQQNSRLTYVCPLWRRLTLGAAVGADPVALGQRRQLRRQAEQVPALVAAVALHQLLRHVPAPALLARRRRRPGRHRRLCLALAGLNALQGDVERCQGGVQMGG